MRPGAACWPWAEPKEKTLTDKEIDKAHQKIEGRLRHVLGAQIRGKDAG